MKFYDAIGRHPNPAALVSTTGLALAPLIDGSGSHPFVIQPGKEVLPCAWVREAWDQVGITKDQWRALPAENQMDGAIPFTKCTTQPMMQRVARVLDGIPTDKNQPALLTAETKAVGIDFEQENLGWCQETSHGWYKTKANDPLRHNTAIRDLFCGALRTIHSRKRLAYCYRFPEWNNPSDVINRMLAASVTTELAWNVDAYCVDFYVGPRADAYSLARKAMQVCKAVDEKSGVIRRKGAMVGYDDDEDLFTDPDLLEHHILALAQAGFEEIYLWASVRSNGWTPEQTARAHQLNAWLEDVLPVTAQFLQAA